MASLIVDTSVWIDFFRGSLNSHILGFLSEGIRQRTVALTDIIRHEILVGALTEKHYQQLTRLLSPFECLRIKDDDLIPFDRFAWNLHRRGLTGKYTDLSIAFLCHRHELPLLVFDGYFHQLARKNIIRVL